MSIASEFKDFINKGNVVDLAVGVVIGGAFGKIIGSLVSDILMPPIGILIGGINFSDIKVILKQASVDAAGKPVDAVSMNIGNFIQVGIEFIIIAAAIFMVVKAMNKMKKPALEAAAPPPGPTKDQQLLMEIRDALKK